ncbi:phosphopantetheine-binding protein [Trichloromonas sp.]|uniref:phosphopantetheine-binding protein n=1 Tax=Trichloromonas sp. TaxID=3069249 RepID=UPI003D8179DC
MEPLSEDGLERELRDLVVEACYVDDAPEEVFPDAPIVGPDSPWGLDSLDAVEIIVEVQKQYDVRIGGQEAGRELLRSLRTLADFIRKERG